MEERHGKQRGTEGPPQSPIIHLPQEHDRSPREELVGEKREQPDRPQRMAEQQRGPVADHGDQQMVAGIPLRMRRQVIPGIDVEADHPGLIVHRRHEEDAHDEVGEHRRSRDPKHTFIGSRATREVVGIMRRRRWCHAAIEL